ncbi:MULTISPECIES: J domain-containing protein [unclassified Coleofasciculus]|uniref:J domain-containing protein n=1 Tax=unclassified Coleofasciculus TaxID=2692782 RepID=UPI001882A7C9|nr:MULTISPECIES: molecular chaperone DnaJ [unclassified Coleofasciculus]MBE9128671.1 molecular chaperone DnaJ [Coleofasciculus sp. LEGE 07081]MBE9147159.1 molecular chaperone DnaJ [Coleofasciculus sp. LEGE 07092]
MNSPYEQLGISPSAPPAQIKAAYHAKLREFPAHTHPQEFKAIRAAYEALSQGNTTQLEDFLTPRPVHASLDPDAIAQLRQRVHQHLELSLEDLIRLTF